MTPYYTDSIHNQPVFRCLRCRYDSFSTDSIDLHCRYQHGPLVLPEVEMPQDQWISHAKDVVSRWMDIKSVVPKLAIGFLTWNTKDASTRGAQQIAHECKRLRDLGIECAVFWADNGSTDGTVAALQQIFESAPCEQIHASENRGQSWGRNRIIEGALGWGCDFLLMVDGDIEIIPYSGFAMTRAMLEYQDPKLPMQVGCIGMYCYNCTGDENDPEVPQDCRKIDPWMLKIPVPIAWTNYGIFSRGVLETCKFDESPAFTGAGWGWEDDDFYVQMLNAGYASLNTPYFRHYHRKRNSSLRNMDHTLAAKVYQERINYLRAKWTGNVHAGHLLRALDTTRLPEVK